MKNLTTHFTNITKGVSDSRSILQGISYNKEAGVMASTDSHRLLYFKSEQIPATYVQNPLTLNFLDGHYPDVTRLLSLSGNNVQFDPKDITPQLIALLKAMKTDVIEIKIQADLLSFHKEHEGSFFSIGLQTTAPENEIIAANAKYVLQGLQLVTDAYKYHTKEDITLNYSSPVRPFTFRTSSYDYLITPVRRSY